MSINLYCYIGKGKNAVEVPLLQTPTWVTRLCLYADMDRYVRSPARTVAAKYIEWVKAIYGNQYNLWDTVRAQEGVIRKALKHPNLRFEAL